MEDTHIECVDCKKRMTCRFCGCQLCERTVSKCHAVGHYVWGHEVECVECHQLENLKGKIG